MAAGHCKAIAIAAALLLMQAGQQRQQRVGRPLEFLFSYVLPPAVR